MKWTSEILAELSKLYQQYNYRICANIMDIPANKVRAAIRNHNLKSGRTGQFKKGHIPFNKGINFITEGSKKTQFKKGHLPHNTKYNGAISIRKDKSGTSYKYIRINKAKWELLHRYNWEQQNGAIPEGCILVAKDGNQLNCDPSNWNLITRAEHAIRNCNREKARLSMRKLYQRERIRKAYGLSPLSAHYFRITNY